MSERGNIVSRKNYKIPEYPVDHVHLSFRIFDENKVEVKGILNMRRNPEAVKISAENPPVILNAGRPCAPAGGQIQKIISVKINEKEAEYKYDGELMTLAAPAGNFQIATTVLISPSANKEGHGLYKTRDILVTQNEALGFREITPYPDRPDILTTWSTEVTADREKYPILLATGDIVKSIKNSDGTNTVEFKSDYKMPSYLYALVAGKFDYLEDETVVGGTSIKLKLFAGIGKRDRLKIAMESLKMSMKWDFENFGRKYPLKEYKIVAVDDFNAGAMENFGLNVFNASSVLGDEKVTTDGGILNIAHTVEHEHGHTWRGDLVTVRTWHELALKEGFQTMTDGLFDEFLIGEVLSRIQHVRGLRVRQFAEDAGSSAHSIWPEEYVGNPSNSMYTSTTYSKGAEVIRMARTLLGKEKFRAGTDKYFADFYGKAATIDDLINCLEAVGGVDLQQFKNWFFQVGTPVCEVSSEYDESRKILKLKVKQNCSRDPKLCLHFPLVVGLIGPDGKNLSIADNGLLNVKKTEEIFVFENVAAGTVPSLLRGFSAPVKLNYQYSAEDLLHLMKYDEDGFNRYEACQRIARMELKNLIGQHKKGEKLSVNEAILQAYECIFNLAEIDAALAVEMLVLPSESELVQEMEIYDYEAAKAARDALRMDIAIRFKEQLRKLYDKYAVVKNSEKVIDVEAIKARKTKNICLGYLIELRGENVVLAKNQIKKAANMTDEYSALCLLVDVAQEREEALENFYQKWKDEELVINNWLRAQASMDDEAVFERVRELMNSEHYDAEKPGHVYSLFIFGFSMNHIYFHKKSGEGYKLATDAILKIKNSDVVSRFIREAFSDLPKMDKARQALMKVELRRIVECTDLPEGPRERARKILEG